MNTIPTNNDSNDTRKKSANIVPTSVSTVVEVEAPSTSVLTTSPPPPLTVIDFRHPPPKETTFNPFDFKRRHWISRNMLSINGRLSDLSYHLSSSHALQQLK